MIQEIKKILNDLYTMGVNDGKNEIGYSPSPVNYKTKIVLLEFEKYIEGKRWNPSPHSQFTDQSPLRNGYNKALDDLLEGLKC